MKGEVENECSTHDLVGSCQIVKHEAMRSHFPIKAKNNTLHVIYTG